MGATMNGTGLTMKDALTLARNSDLAARDPTVVHALEVAITYIWDEIQAKPDTYLMTPDEFGVFNYFQSRFEGSEIAVAARKRYWDSQS
jgi:hypothetical protein